ncbi:MupA/Atu3671 family FMN-dependent luciferase-like monooxygenase [Methylocystis sp.]|uniref:MupA/Atu3671 family FMN-dependent luciferase-like monooxygenase n=1 Tax=Methylocystis sp. TaxID=1911079 RepID=UPI003DA4CA10
MDLEKRIANLPPERRELLEKVVRAANLTWPLAAARAPSEPMPTDVQACCSLSLMFFASCPDPGQPYDLLLKCARFADDAGFEAVWIPERHFVDFGGHFSAPAVLCAALAMATERIGLRAGSVVLPLDEPLRIVEQWSIVDNLSRGRVAISCAAGWHPNDFCLAPDHFQERRRLMIEGIEVIRESWRGRKLSRINGVGALAHVIPRPRPVQDELPLWITAVGADSFRLAGELGTNILTGLIGMDLTELGRRIEMYRDCRRQTGHKSRGQVTLMQHALLGDDLSDVRTTSSPFMKSYLASFIGQSGNELATNPEIGGLMSTADTGDRNAFLAHVADTFIRERSLIGTPRSCQEALSRLSQVGVDEVACLVDFGPPPEVVLASLARLARLKDSMADQTK